MATLPVSTDLTGSAITEAQAKTWFTQLRDFLSGLLGTAGTIPTALAALQVPFAPGLMWISTAYSVTTADRGKVIGVGAAVTVTLPAAATAGSGFMVAVHAYANGVVVDGNGAELIDAVASLTLNSGESAIFVSNGGEWWTVGRTIQTTPGYRHAAGSSIYSRYDRTDKCGNITSYESIPAWGDPGVLTDGYIVSGGTDPFFYSYMVPMPDGWFLTTGAHEDPAFRVDHAGTITVYFQMRRSYVSGTAYARVCKNGAEVQAWSQTSESFVAYSVNVDVKVGDLITIQRKSSNSSIQTTETKFHRILITQPT